MKSLANHINLQGPKKGVINNSCKTNVRFLINSGAKLQQANSQSVTS